MRTMAFLTLVALVPLAAAMPPAVEAWTGEASIRAFFANGMTVCRGEGDAALTIEREMEAATFVLAIAAPCVPALTLRGALNVEGWRFEDPLGIQSGSFSPVGDGTWNLVALVDSCPPFVICEFAHGVRVQGTFTPLE